MGDLLAPAQTLAAPSCHRTAANLSPTGASLGRVQPGMPWRDTSLTCATSTRDLIRSGPPAGGPFLCRP